MLREIHTQMETAGDEASVIHMGHRPMHCYICGEPVDRRGDHCKACHKAFRRNYSVSHVRALGRLNVSPSIKRRCIGCEELHKCITFAVWADEGSRNINVYEYQKASGVFVK